MTGLLPEVAQIPYGFILQLRAKQWVGLGQNGYQPTRSKDKDRAESYQQGATSSLCLHHVFLLSTGAPYAEKKATLWSLGVI